MTSESKPNEITLTIMLNFYANQCMEREACEMFENLQIVYGVSFQSNNHFGCMIKLWTNLKNWKKAIEYYSLADQTLDIATTILTLSACAESGYLHVGQLIDKKTRNLKDCNLSNALINMYARCGDLGNAKRVFNSQIERDVITWTCIVNAFGIHGMGSKSISLFKEMIQNNIPPNEHTLTCLLNACARSDMYEEAIEIYDNMEKRFAIKPTIAHTTCLIDVCSRRGNVEMVTKLIQSIDKLDVIATTRVLETCRKLKWVEMAEYLFKILKLNNELDTSHILLMIGVYDSLGMGKELEDMRSLLEQGDYKKIPNITELVWNGTVHSFCYDETKHDNSSTDVLLNSLMNDLVKSGYTPNINCVNKKVSDEEKVKLLSKHSEKIALAYIFSRDSTISSVRLTNTVRMCEDCHNAVKILSQIRKCEILIRDPSRFHHFKDGKCSCGDYW